MNVATGPAPTRTKHGNRRQVLNPIADALDVNSVNVRAAAAASPHRPRHEADFSAAGDPSHASWVRKFADADAGHGFEVGTPACRPYDVAMPGGSFCGTD